MSLTEKGFQQAVLDLARLNGFLCYHTFDSRRSEPGYPDISLVHPDGRFFMRELKVGRNQLTQPQFKWLSLLQNAGVDASLWRPEMWSEIETTLARRPR